MYASSLVWRQRAIILAILCATWMAFWPWQPGAVVVPRAAGPAPYAGDYLSTAPPLTLPAAAPDQDRRLPAAMAAKAWRRRHRKRRRRPPLLSPVVATPLVTPPPAAPPPPPALVPVGRVQAYALALVGKIQFACVDAIFTRESGWRWNAYNPSGAYGIPQALPGSKMASAGADWRTNPLTQVRWGIGYMDRIYGSPCAAWAFWQAHSYY